MIEGRGLDELARHLQQGSVVNVVEFTPTMWPLASQASLTSRIQKIEKVIASAS